MSFLVLLTWPRVSQAADPALTCAVSWQGPCSGTLVVGRVGAAGEDDAQRRVLDQLLTGIRAGISEGQRDDVQEGPALYSAVLSLDALRTAHEHTLRDLEAVERVFGQNLSKTKKSIRKIEKQAQGILVVTVSQTAAGLLVLLNHEPLAEGRRKLRNQRVGGDGSSEQEVLEGVANAGRNLVRGLNQPPVAQVAGASVRDLALGKPLVLDGAPSFDADYDETVLTWTQTVEDPARRIIPTEGVLRGKLELRPPVAGTYTFWLTAAAGREVSTPTSVVVHVHEAPRAVAGDSRLVEMDEALASVTVEGKCEHCKEFRWRQVRGPAVVIEPQDWTSTQPSGEPVAQAGELAGRFSPQLPGVYVFELQVRNGLSADADQTTLTLAPKPNAIASGAISIQLDDTIILDARASSDALDSNPIYHWELSDTKFEKHCTISGRRSSYARLLNPSSEEPTLVAQSLPDWQMAHDVHARLVMSARRNLDDRHLRVYACDDLEIQVTRGKWNVGLFAGKEFSELGGAALVTIVANGILFPAGLGLRLEQTLAHDLLNEEGERGPLGGTSVHASWTVPLPLEPLRTLLRVHGGAYFRHTGGFRLGPSLGTAFHWHLWPNLSLALNADVIYLAAQAKPTARKLFLTTQTGLVLVP